MKTIIQSILLQKTKIQFSFFVTISSILISLNVYSQNTYKLNLSDTSSYDSGCGKLTASSWTVKNDSCVLYTPYFRRETVGCGIVYYNFVINQSGNGDIEDLARIQYNLNNSGWQTDTLIYASNYSAVHNLIGSFQLCLSDMIQLRVIMKTNNKSEFWAIKNGEITLSGSFTTYSGNPGPMSGLPVEMSYFEGSVISNTPILKWATYSEINSDYFVIERSLDGKLFKSIASIKGAGNSNSLTEYIYYDKELLSSKNINYRLRQTDFDGKYTYYGPILITKSEKTEAVLVFPNPASVSDKISIVLSDVYDADITEVIVYNSLGEIIFRSTFSESSYNMNLTSKGIYYIIITSRHEIIKNEKLIVQ